MPARAEDIQLVDEVIRGVPGAFDRLLRRIGKVVDSCLARTRSKAPWIRTDEDDLRQSFQLMLVDRDYRILREYEGRAALTTWIYVVAMRFFRRQADRLRRHYDGHDPDAVGHLETRVDPPDRSHHRRQEVEAVQARVKDLSADDQLLLALLFEQELSAPEIAPILGMTPSGVRMRKARLLERLSKKLGKGNL